MSNDGYHIPPSSTDPFEYTMAEAIYGWRSRDLDFLEREEAVYQAVHNASRASTNGLSTPQDSERSNGQAQSNNTNDSNKEPEIVQAPGKLLFNLGSGQARMIEDLPTDFSTVRGPTVFLLDTGRPGPNLNHANTALPATKPISEKSEPMLKGFTVSHVTGNHQRVQKKPVCTMSTEDREKRDLTRLAQLSEDDLKNLNRRIFHYYPDEVMGKPNEAVLTIFVGRDGITIHQCAVVRSKVLQEKFKNQTEFTLTDIGAFHDIELAEVKILMQAIYGVHSPILGHGTYKGSDYIKAIWLCDMLLCDPCVRETVVLCARGHFSAFKHWPSIPANIMTQDFHREKLVEVNEAYKVYKILLKEGGARVFRENSFAILLAQFCPDFVYCLYSDILDCELAQHVSVAAIRMRDRVAPFSSEEMKLFICPSP